MARRSVVKDLKAFGASEKSDMDVSVATRSDHLGTVSAIFSGTLDSPLTDRCNDVRLRKIFNSFERDGFIIFPREGTSDEDLFLSVLDYLESSNSCDVRSAL